MGKLGKKLNKQTNKCNLIQFSGNISNKEGIFLRKTSNLSQKHDIIFPVPKATKRFMKPIKAMSIPHTVVHKTLVTRSILYNLETKHYQETVCVTPRTTLPLYRGTVI